MFTVTQYQDGYEHMPVQTHRAETYREAYTWAYGWGKGFARLLGDGYCRVEHDDQTWLDRVDVFANGHDLLKGDQRIHHIEIACDDLDAWHAVVIAGSGSVWG